MLDTDAAPKKWCNNTISHLFVALIRYALPLASSQEWAGHPKVKPNAKSRFKANESWRHESVDVQRYKKGLIADSQRSEVKNRLVTWLQQFLQVWPKVGASISSSSRGQSTKIENSQPQKMWPVTSPRLGCIAVITATCLIHRGPGNQSIKWSSYQRTNETEPSELAAAGAIPNMQPTCTQSSRPVASSTAQPNN